MLKLEAIALLFVVANAAAQSPSNGQDKTLEWALSSKCSNEAAANICAGYELALKQAEMARMLQQEQDKLKGFAKAQEHLAAAQAAWQKFADADCTFQAGEPGPESGTGYPWRFASCMRSQVQARIEHLKTYLACQHDGCWPQP